MRLITGGISHETNVFSPFLNDNFRVINGEEYLASERTSGFLDACTEHGFELVPTIFASGVASGMITDEALKTVLGELLDGIKHNRPFDGILLRLHGAGVSKSYPDIEGYILSEVRNLVGFDMPIVSTFDFHGNHSTLTVENVDVLVGHDTNPHIDGYERGLEALHIMKRLIEGRLKPTKALRKPRMMPYRAITTRNPMKRIMDAVHRIEKLDGVETITVAQGFTYADVEHAGMSIIVTTNDDQRLADKCADELNDLTWSLRRDFLCNDIIPVSEAIKRVRDSKEGPIILADTGDVSGGGGTCKGIVALKAVLEVGLENGVVATIADPEAVEKAIEAGVGNYVTMDLGGKIDKLHGKPIKVTGLVNIISNGKYIRTGSMGKPTSGRTREANMGRTVVLRIGSVDVIITERRVHPTDLQVYRSLGIEPTEKRFIVVKSMTHFHASHEPIAKEIIYLDTPGLSSARLAGFDYRNLKRPIFPLDVEMLGIIELKTMEEK